MPTTIPFIPGDYPVNPGPLSRFLPPLPEGVVENWLEEQRHKNRDNGQLLWVLDPFGASPRIAIEAAQAGARILVAANNPITRFLIEIAARSPTETDLQSALSELAAAYKGDERIEPHIRSLYTTECAQCSQEVMVEAFLWERQAPVPYARLYRCPHCGDSGEYPATQADQEKASHFATVGLHRSRALERVALPNDPDRTHAEEALSVYLPRAVYALFTLINKLDGLNLTPDRRNHLCALLLTACDRANALWAHPTLRERPRQLTVPPRFRENNIWLALEQGVSRWSSNASGVPLTLWPELPPVTGGICIFEGRLKDLAEKLLHKPDTTSDQQKETTQPLKIGQILAALPRPNQAFWTLSALWSGWIWGREAVAPFKAVLRRRRYDWSWHTSALAAAFSNLVPVIDPGTPFLGLIAEAEPGFLGASIVAADMAGFDLLGISMRSEMDLTQAQWMRPAALVEPELKVQGLESRAEQAATQAARSYLEEHGEPAYYLTMYSAAISGIAWERIFHDMHKTPPIPEQGKTSATTEPSTSSIDETTPAEIFSLAQTTIKDVLSYKGGFRRFSATESPESGQWWLQDETKSAPPLYDRVEIALVNFLHEHPLCTFGEMDANLCQTFPGLSTPELELLHVCLESYGVQEPPDSRMWQLRTQDQPEVRREDLKLARQHLEQLAGVLGFTTREGEPRGTKRPVLWVDEKGRIRYRFFLIASAVLGEIILSDNSQKLLSDGHCLVVLPGGRANLVAYKIRRDPRLRNLCRLGETEGEPEETWYGWRFIKFRHLRWLVGNPLLTRENLEEFLVQDPLTFTAPQMRLL